VYIHRVSSQLRIMQRNSDEKKRGDTHRFLGHFKLRLAGYKVEITAKCTLYIPTSTH
jgi:hypothetical protein